MKYRTISASTYLEKKNLSNIHDRANDDNDDGDEYNDDNDDNDGCTDTVESYLFVGVNLYFAGLWGHNCVFNCFVALQNNYFLKYRWDVSNQRNPRTIISHGK